MDTTLRRNLIKQGIVVALVAAISVAVGASMLGVVVIYAGMTALSVVASKGFVSALFQEVRGGQPAYATKSVWRKPQGKQAHWARYRVRVR